VQIASFRDGETSTYGVVRGDRVFEASQSLRTRFPDLRAVLRDGALDELARDSAGAGRLLDEIEFLPTIPNPDKLLCVGINYRPHVEEMGRQVPERPMIFVRFPGGSPPARTASRRIGTFRLRR
jgi:2-keto-4-pentenoate hydratase/2-oxohepta-3-ene-1,7-dioic acid hydratase in catechol pathway